MTVEGNVKSVLIENALAQEVFEKQILAPWDAFCVELTERKKWGPQAYRV